MESNFSVLKANSRLTRSHSVHWWLSHQRPVRMGLSKVQPPSINTVQPIQVYNIYSLSLQLDNRGRSSHSWILVCLKRWVRPHMPLSHRLNELATDNNRSGMGSPGWCMSQWSTSTFWNSCGWTALDTPEWRKWPSRQTGGQSTPNKWVASWKIWTVERSLRHYLQAKKSQGHHPISHLEERGMKWKSAQWSSLKWWVRAIINQTNIVTGTVLKPAFGKLLRVIYIIWSFSKHLELDTILNLTGIP